MGDKRQLLENIPAYLHLTRKQALDILSRARLSPDRFTAHRDHTFTAHYLRGRELIFMSDEFEGRLDSADKRVAILKRPCPKMDRGRYITLQFAFAPFEIESPRENPAPKRTRAPRTRQAMGNHVMV
jgi:hypothetical protein